MEPTLFPVGAHSAGRFLTIEKRRTSLILAAVILGLLVLSVWAVRAASTPELVTGPALVQTVSGSSFMAAGRTEALSNFEQKTQALFAAVSDKAYHALLLSLKENKPLAYRGIVLAALQGASPAVFPVLMDALSDADPGIRAGAAQVLGMRHEYQAIAVLTAATYDANSEVRLQAVRSLDALHAWQVLPRLEQLSLNEGSFDVRLAAGTAKDNLSAMFADEIGVSASQLRDISVTPTDPPHIYAVTTTDLFARHGARWEQVSRLPDAPLAIATGSDPTLIYLATVRAGLYRSLDRGETWEHADFDSLTPLTITAVVVDPQNSLRMYIALVAQSEKPGSKNVSGIFSSQDSGNTWTLLADAPAGAVTTQLVVDPQSPGYLFGMIADTPWRYKLPLDVPAIQ